MAIEREVGSNQTGPGIELRDYHGRQIAIQTSHVGQVVETGQTYLYDGEYSYWAVIGNPDGSFEQIAYASTYPGFGKAEVDAPPALLSAWQAEKARRQAEAQRAAAEHAAEMARYEAEVYARTPRRGSFVRVVKGRKVPIGREGTVFWTGESAWGARVGVDFGGEREFVSAANVEVLAQPD